MGHLVTPETALRAGVVVVLAELVREFGWMSVCASMQKKTLF
jgi:hypothetical protein